MKFLIIISAILLSRLAPHPANFTVIGALALLAGHTYRKDSSIIWLSLGGLIATDALMGFHSTIGFVYLGFILSGLLAYKMSSYQSVPAWLAKAVSGSLIFFVVSNGGVWLVDGMYPMTLSGLGQCYVAGLPFLKNQLLGDLVWTTSLVAAFAALSKLQGGRYEAFGKGFIR